MSRDRLLEVVESGMVDWLTFTAGSTVRGFVELVGPQTGGASVAAISPITAAAITGAGLPVHAVAETHTSAGLVQAIGAAITEAIG